MQVDLQDLGYETCGRSENEAEREDASSPGNGLPATLTEPRRRFAITLQLNPPPRPPPFSSADFDDLEMCTSLSLRQDYEADDGGGGGGGGGWYPGNGGGESAHLQHLVEDLRSQLTRCHKVIRGLQMRVRSLSATSDYASSLERTPRKVLRRQPRKKDLTSGLPSSV